MSCAPICQGHDISAFLLFDLILFFGYICGNSTFFQDIFFAFLATAAEYPAFIAASAAFPPFMYSVAKAVGYSPNTSCKNRSCSASAFRRRIDSSGIWRTMEHLRIRSTVLELRFKSSGCIFDVKSVIFPAAVRLSINRNISCSCQSPFF